MTWDQCPVEVVESNRKRQEEENQKDTDDEQESEYDTESESELPATVDSDLEDEMTFLRAPSCSQWTNYSRYIKVLLAFSFSPCSLYCTERTENE